MKKIFFITLVALTTFSCTLKKVASKEKVKKESNWKYSYDFDNDKINDSIATSFSKGAHCCYYLKIKLSSENKWKDINAEIDGGYLLGLDLSNKENFNISDFDNDNKPEIIFKNSDNSKMLIDFIKETTVFYTKLKYINQENNYIITCSDKTINELKQQVTNDIAEWKNVKNPIIASYVGNEVLDYFHIEFKGEDGKIYDFGTGNNDFGQYKLFDKSDQYLDNPKYLGKKFKIFWEWKESSFPCCSGDYEIVVAMQPSIIKLDLLEN